MECHEMANIEFTFPYLAMNDVMKVAKSSDVSIVEQIFDNACQMTVATRLDYADAVKKRLTDIDGVTLKKEE